MHIRFRSPDATALGERVAPFLAKGRFAAPPRKRIQRAHRAAKRKKPNRG
jgi:hypothetical protein